LAILLSLVFVVSVAQAGPKKKKKKTKKADVVDVSAWKDKFHVYTDGDGSYMMGVPGESESVFYGDGKTMYKQRAFGSSRNPPKWDFRMWSPRVSNVADFGGSDDTTDKAGFLNCAADEFELTRVDSKDAEKIIAKAQFLDVLWQRQAEKLSRDDRGTYYYVDRLRDEYGGKGYRLFAGQKGAMKELPLTNIVSDSKGQIFASKRGELRFVIEEDQPESKATWIKGEKKTELTNVPVEDNIALIYGELGVYEGTLGTPCDDY
jgi:hypothetical protein